MSLGDQFAQIWLEQQLGWVHKRRFGRAALGKLKINASDPSEALHTRMDRLIQRHRCDLSTVEVLPSSLMPGVAKSYEQRTNKYYPDLNKHWLKIVEEKNVSFLLITESSQNFDAQLNANDAKNYGSNSLIYLILTDPKMQFLSSSSNKQVHSLIFNRNHWIKSNFESQTNTTGGDITPYIVDSDGHICFAAKFHIHAYFPMIIKSISAIQ